MNNWLNRLERRYGRFGIPNLTNILVGGQILVLAIELFVNQTISVWLSLSRYLLLSGQIWRIITFVFIPSYGGSILSAVLGIYFTWFIGTALEREWGDFRYTVYLLSGMLGTVLACLLTGVSGGQDAICPWEVESTEFDSHDTTVYTGPYYTAAEPDYHGLVR